MTRRQFQIEASRPADGELKRLAAERYAEIRDLVADKRTDPAELVHKLRVAIKRQRAFWRLLDPVLPEGFCQRENGRLREAAGKLGAGRDRVVARKTLAARKKAYGESAMGRAFGIILRALGRDGEREEAVPRSIMQQARKAIHDSAALFGRAQTSSPGWEAVAPGLGRAYGKARKAMPDIQASDGDFHAWRKRVKDLWYALAAMEPLAPHRLKPLNADLDKLQKMLGEDHDLVMVESRLFARALPEGDFSALALVLLDLRRESLALRREALRLGSRVFKEKARQIVKEIGRESAPAASGAGK